MLKRNIKITSSVAVVIISLILVLSPIGVPVYAELFCGPESIFSQTCSGGVFIGGYIESVMSIWSITCFLFFVCYLWKFFGYLAFLALFISVLSYLGGRKTKY